MELKQLEYFTRVAELGSFTRAAVLLNVAQPVLSRQVRQLEVELRQVLLVRNGRGAVPTEAGQLLLSHARGILHQVERAHEELGRVRGALAGRVRIGLPTTLARILTVPLTRAFRQQLPQAQLSITEGLSISLQEALVHGRLDMTVLYNAQPSAEVEITPMFDELLWLVQAQSLNRGHATQAAPIALQEIANVPLIMPSRPNAIRMHIESEMANIGCRPNVVLEIDGVSAILDLVADGAGSAILSSNAVASAVRPQAFILRAIHSPVLHTKLSLAISSQRPATQTQEALAKLVQETAKCLFAIK